MTVQIDDYSMVRFLPFDRTDEEGINIVLQHIDFSIQYGEDLDFKEPKVKKCIGKDISIHLYKILIYFFFIKYFLLFLHPQEVEEEPSNLNYDEIFQDPVNS